ncbi:MAG: OsmC family protein [Alphaproteobacteria bacterium]|nr:OsmC family protein [Alphaproteobacteria bacterium]
MSNEVSVSVTRQDKYRFLVDFGSGLTPTMADEPPPLGDGAGPSPSHLLAAAVANCLSASLVFANAKFKEDPGALTATATCEIGRNERNRLRVTGIKVTITLRAPPEGLAHLDRALAQFEDFCTVSQSVRTGIPLTVTVKAADGRVVK